MKSLVRLIGGGIACGYACTAGVAFSADFTWLNAPASGLWNTNDVNWSGAGTVWANGATNNATFGASTVQTLTADAVTLSNLTFTADGYSLGGGPLLMNGGFVVGSGQTALVTATVSNIVGICEKTGAGTLVLNSGDGYTNRFSTLRVTAGTVQIKGGTIDVSTNSGGTIYTGFDIRGGSVIVGGGKVRMTTSGYSDVMGSLLITNGTVDLSVSQETLNAFNGAGTTTVSGNGILDVTKIRISQYNQNLASQNAINVNTGGVLRLNSFAIDPDASPKGMVNFNGGTVVAKSSATDFLGTWTNKWLNGIICRVLEGGAVIDTGAYAISIKQPLVSGASADGGLIKKGTGSLSLLSTNTFNGGTTIGGGTLNISQDLNLGVVPALSATNLMFLGSGTLQSGSNNVLAANRTIWITNAVTATFDSQAYTQTVNGVIVCAETNATFYKTGNGVLVLDPGPAAVNRFGTLQETAGTLVIASGTNLVMAPNSGQNAPGLRVSGGTLLMAGGYLKTTALMFVNVDGGHLLVTNGIVDTTSCYELLNSIGGNGFGYTTVRDSGVIIANQVRISQNGTPATNSVVTLATNGVMKLNYFYIDTNFSLQKGMLVLNGGVAEARQSNDNFLGTTATFVGNANDKWLTNIFVRVREGGAIFNTAGFNISIKQPILSDVGSDGGLTKRGAGVLTLLNTNVYGGATSVAGGTLRLGVATNTLQAGGTVWVASNAVFDVNGKVQSLAALGGSGTVSNNASLTVTGLVAPGGTNAVGTLTLASACPLSGEMRVDVSATGACDRLTVQDNLDLSGLSLTLANADQLNKDYRYVFVTYAGALSGAFASVSVPTRWGVQYDAVNRRVYLVYNRGTMLAVR